MTIDDLAQMTFSGKLNTAEVEAFCQQEQITSTVFLDKFARYIATGYVEDRFTWLSCDTAMNNLMGLMSHYLMFPDFAYGAFLAFDAGEYHPKTKDLSPDEVTRPLINTLMAKHPAH